MCAIPALQRSATQPVLLPQTGAGGDLGPAFCCVGCGLGLAPNAIAPAHRHADGWQYHLVSGARFQCAQCVYIPMTLCRSCGCAVTVPRVDCGCASASALCLRRAAQAVPATALVLWPQQTQPESSQSQVQVASRHGVTRSRVASRVHPEQPWSYSRSPSGAAAGRIFLRRSGAHANKQLKPGPGRQFYACPGPGSVCGRRAQGSSKQVGPGTG